MPPDNRLPRRSSAPDAPETNPGPTDPTSGAEAFDDKFLSMTEGEFEDFLAIAVEGYADAMETPLANIRTFREAGVLTVSAR